MRAKPIIAAIVLAAGRSTRMGEINKLLTDFNGQPMVAQTLAQVQAAGIRQICVVTGHQAEKIEAALDENEVVFAHNGDFRDGLSTSIIAGVRALGSEINGVVIMLGDMPLVSGRDINSLVAAFQNNSDICVPNWQGKRGNPVLWGRDYFAQLQELTRDMGARDLLKQFSGRVIEVDMPDDGVLRDFDTAVELADRSK